MNSLLIRCYVLAGTDIAKAAADAIALAKKLDCTVTFEFNDVACSVMPESSAIRLAGEFHAALNSTKTPKMAFG